MPESSCFRTPFGSEGAKQSETLLKSGRQHFFPNFPLISNKLSCVSCLLIRSAIVGPLFDMLTADHKYSCNNWEKFLQEVQQQLSSKVKTEIEIETKFWALWKKKISFIALLFWKLLSPKNVVIWMPERCCFRTLIGSQRVKWPETLLKSARQPFYNNFPLISEKLSCVSCTLVGSEIFGQFSNILPADQKYSCYNRKNSSSKFNQKYLRKQKDFWEVLLHFWNWHKFWEFPEKGSPS